MGEREFKEISAKFFFTKYGICAAFFVAVLFFVVFSALCAKNAWNRNLKVVVEDCLEENMPGIWSVGDVVEISNPCSVCVACYEVINKETGDAGYSAVSRVMTVFGPMNCVFVCSESGGVFFVGVSGIRGRIHGLAEDFWVSAKARYYYDRLPLIIGCAVTEVEND